MEGGGGKAGRGEADTVAEAICPRVNSAPSCLSLHGIWDRAQPALRELGNGQIERAEAGHIDKVLLLLYRSEWVVCGGSLTLRCQHLTQQKIHNPVKIRKPAIPPSTLARSFGQAQVNAVGKTEREREREMYSAHCPPSGH